MSFKSLENLNFYYDFEKGFKTFEHVPILNISGEI